MPPLASKEELMMLPFPWLLVLFGHHSHFIADDYSTLCFFPHWFLVCELRLVEKQEPVSCLLMSFSVISNFVIGKTGCVEHQGG